MDSTDFQLEDYKLKVSWMAAHYDRVLRRFQMFATLEIALAALLIIAQTGELSPAAPKIAGLELAISIVWLVAGRADRRVMRVQQHDVRRVGEKVAASMSINPYVPVTGQMNVAREPGVIPFILETDSVQEPPLIPALIPVTMVLLWIVVLLLILFVS